MVNLRNFDPPDREFLLRLLEIYSLSDILELCDLEDAEALELLVMYGAIDLGDIPA